MTTSSKIAASSLMEEIFGSSSSPSIPKFTASPFAKFFQSGDAGYRALKSDALQGKLDPFIRNIAWKVFLGIIPENSSPEEWPSIIHQHRTDYEALRKKHLDLTLDASVIQDPLLSSPAASKFERNKTLAAEIKQDVTRTYPDMEFFQSVDTQTLMINALFIYCSENPLLSYRQGMHELFAVLLIVLHRGLVNDHDTDHHSSHADICNLQFIEHDSYTIFSKLMPQVESWYYTSEIIKEGSTPIVAKSHYIQGTLLKKFDPLLQNYLEEKEIEPQIYALRWVRLLFGREFHVDDLVILWDAIFAHGKALQLIDYIAIAMLMYIRTDLLRKDTNDCLRRLLRFPPVEDIRVFVQRSQSLLQGKGQLEISNSLSPAPSTPSSSSSSSTMALLSSLVPKRSAPSPPFNRKKMEEDLKTMKRQDEFLSHRLERIVCSLQHLCALPGVKPEVIMSIAELKHIKDILGGQIVFQEIAFTD